MTTSEDLYADTDCAIRTITDRIDHTPVKYYAACTATGCTWVGPTRTTSRTAKADARRHANSTSS